jgi:hypothetical protein
VPNIERSFGGPDFSFSTAVPVALWKIPSVFRCYAEPIGGDTTGARREDDVPRGDEAWCR